MPVIASACSAFFCYVIKSVFMSLLGNLYLVMVSYLSVPSVVRLCSVGCWDEALRLNLKKKRKEGKLPWPDEIPFQHFPGTTEENHQGTLSDTRGPGPDSNRAPPERVVFRIPQI
jgi:hypothetical protein